MTIGAVAAAIVWAALTLLLPPQSLTPLTPLLVGGAALLLWLGLTVLNTMDEPYFVRLAFTGGAAVAAWVLMTAVLMLLTVPPFGAGVAAIVLLWFFAQGAPVWVIDIEPGEVLYYRPIYHRPYKYELVSCPVQRIEADLKPSGLHGSPSITRFSPTGAATTHQVSSVELAIDYLWVRPVDELRLLWKMEKHIIVETRVEDIITRDHSAFTLWIKVAATLDPTRIRGRNFLLLIPRLDSPARLETTMRGIITDNVDKAAREFFIQYTAAEARGEIGVVGFRRQMVELLKGMSENLGLTFIESMINSTPILSQEVRFAAERAAASVDNSRADLATTERLVELAMSGSAPHQLLLYSRIVERGGQQFRVAPSADQLPQLSPVDQFLWRLSNNDPQAVQLLRTMASQHPELPLPANLQTYLALPSGTGDPTPPAFSTPAASVPPSELPLPAPARVRPDVGWAAPTPPSVPPPGAAPAVPLPPDTLPENLAAPAAPPPGMPRPPAAQPPGRASLDIRGALNTRQRPDGTYEVDFDDEEGDE
jgi:hypothetical protein